MFQEGKEGQLLHASHFTYHSLQKGFEPPTCLIELCGRLALQGPSRTLTLQLMACLSRGQGTALPITPLAGDAPTHWSVLSSA